MRSNIGITRQSASRNKDRDGFPNTRMSLISRVRRQDGDGWEEFDAIYGKLIQRVARSKGLNNADAKDVAQEAYLAVVKGINKFTPDQKGRSFRRWLRTIVSNKIADQYRKRIPVSKGKPKSDNKERRTATIERIPDPDRLDLEKIWDVEWAKTILEIADKQVKSLASIEQYQIYDLYVKQDLSATKVAKMLDVSVASVYLAKHRVGGLYKKALKHAEHSMEPAE